MTQLLIDQVAPSLGRRPTGSFNPQLAARLCAASAAAYDGGGVGESIECEATETRAVVTTGEIAGLERREGLIVAFRGTRDLRNWVTDLECLQTGYPCVDYGACRVHRGFWQAWVSVRQSLWDALRARGVGVAALRPPVIYMTGHSLGGALAMLAAERLRREFNCTPIVYTFGQPRVGNVHFAAMYDLALRPFTWRIVHADDIVPRVPWSLGIYRHAGNEAFYGAFRAAEGERNGSVECDPLWNPSPIEKLPFDIRNAWRELRDGKLALLEDHHVNNYLSLFPRKPAIETKEILAGANLDTATKGIAAL